MWRRRLQSAAMVRESLRTRGRSGPLLTLEAGMYISDPGTSLRQLFE